MFSVFATLPLHGPQRCNFHNKQLSKTIKYPFPPHFFYYCTLITQNSVHPLNKIRPPLVQGCSVKHWMNHPLEASFMSFGKCWFLLTCLLRENRIDAVWMERISLRGNVSGQVGWRNMCLSQYTLSELPKRVIFW